MKILLKILPLFIFLHIACTDNPQDDISCPVISFNSSSFENVENVLLDTLVKSVEYVILETTPMSLIANIGGVTVTGNEIIITSRNKILIFDRKGNFLTRLGSYGKGPEEYLSPLNVMYDDIKEIYTIYDYNHILQFDSQKRFIRKLDHESFLKRVYQIGSELFVSERSVEPFYGDSVVFALEFFDQNFNIIYRYPTPEPTSVVEGSMFIVDLMGGINNSPEGLLFRNMCGDTIYRLTDKMEVKPALVLDFGNEKYNRELNFDMNLYMETSKNTIQYGKFTLVGNTLISQFSYDGGLKYAVTNIQDNSTIIPLHKSSDEYGFMLTDFPAHNFQPFFIDGFLAGTIQPLEAKDKLSNESGTIPEETVKKILSLNEDDNPVLVLGKY